MFYQTQVSKLITGGIIDTNGRQLRFCGNLPVSEGDYVWTDGTVVFGHVPIRDTPILQPIEGGIPAAFADDKGYFSKTGRFSKYSIAVDKTEPHWIVNGKRKYFHSDTRVFDAEISIDENGVEDGLFTAELDGINGGNAGIYFVQDDTVIDDDAVVIKKDGKEISRVYLHDYIHAIDKAQEIVARGSIAPAEKKLVGHSQLLNFQLHTDGSWDAIIASFAYVESRYDYDEEGHTIYKVVESHPGYIYKNDAYRESNHLVLFSSDDTFDDMVTKMRDKFSELGFDVKGDLYNAVAETARGVGDVATIWDFGELVDIKENTTRHTERCICTYYLVHANSKGVTKILHEYVSADILKIFGDDTLELQEISASENDVEFFRHAIWEEDYIVAGKALAVTDPFGLSPIFFDIRVKYFQGVRHHPLLYSDDAISIRRYQPTWLYPLQDEYWCQMDEWKILAIFDKDNNPIVRTFKDSDEPFSFPLENARWLYEVNAIGQISFQQFYRDSLTPISSHLISISPFLHSRNAKLGAYSRYQSPTYLPRGKNFQYLTKRYSASEGSRDTAWLYLPAVVKLKNGGYLVGIPQHGIYKVDSDGVAELISDKNQLANLRLRYMPNLSKTRL